MTETSHADNEGVPSVCPTCGTQVPPGGTRCPGCGRVFGEDNRCPHCHAIAGVRMAGADYLCAACGKPRERRPNTTVLNESAPGPGRLAAAAAGAASLGPSAAGRAKAAGVRFLGASSIAFGVVLGAILAMLISGPVGLVLALIAGGGLIGAGFYALKRAAQIGVRSRQADVLRLAAEHHGRLTATDVSRRLGLTLIEADALLTSMADGLRVGVEVDPNGVVHYVFNEMAPSTPVRVRVDGESAERPEHETSVGRAGEELRETDRRDDKPLAEKRR